MDVAGGVLIEGHRLEQDVVGASWWVLNIDELVEFIFAFEDVRVRLFTNLALELLPIMARNVLTVLFCVALSLDPVL